MKKISNILLVLGISALLVPACVDRFAVGDAFLEKAPGVDVNIDTVFSSAEYTRNFLWSAYGQIYCTYTSGNMMNGAPIDVLSDSYHCYVSWGGPKQSYYPGLLTEDAQDTEDGNFQGKFSYSTKGGLDSDAGGRVSIYETVRKCWQIIENIERVPDMADDEKSRLKGEAYTIMASRYFDAFRNFGGLCLARKAYGVGEHFTTGRATAMETVEFIDSLIVCAINEPGFIWNVPDADIVQWSGRLTKASARALRAKVWMFAASPLFNDDAPYLDYTPDKVTEFTNIQHVWFGKKDASLWNRCLQYCNDFFDENAANGNYYQLIQPTTNDEAGYRMAFRRAYRYRNDATHHEKLFDAHPTQKMSDVVRDGATVQNGWGWGWAGFALDCYRQGGAVPTNELVECFGMADGTNFPYADIYGAGKNPTGIDMYADRDPRLYETVLVPRQSLPAGFDYAGFNYVDTWVNGAYDYDAGNFAANNPDDVASGFRKFKWLLDYSNDRMNDEFIGVAYIRLAEMYLIRAEAKAETGDLTGALADLHVVRSRVGLGKLEDMNPGLDLKNNKKNLIEEILRERNCEIGSECGDRLYDMVRRKRQDLFTKPLHEIRIYRLDASGNRLTEGDQRWDPSTPWPKFEYEKPVIVNGARRWWDPGFWTNKWYIDPVSRIEVQKKYGLTQNPGW